MDPLWKGSGLEDFHPKSDAGSWEPASQSFVLDPASFNSATIDGADPSEPVGQGVAPNGGRANLGSYGDSSEASKTPTLPSGCGMVFNVKKGGAREFTDLQSAVGGLPRILDKNACLILRDTLTYLEQVTVEGFVNNGNRITITKDPSFPPNSMPTVEAPSNSTAAFRIFNDSVTLSNLKVDFCLTGISYGVQSSSSYVTISSVIVNGFTSAHEAGITVSSWSTVEYTSVSVQSGHGFYLQGA